MVNGGKMKFKETRAHFMVRFKDEDYNKLIELSKKYNVTKTEAVRRSIRFAYFNQINNLGDKK